MPNYRLKMHEGWGMPPSAPYYELPNHYRNLRTQSILFRADENAIYDLLPEPLEPAPGGLCRVNTVHAPFASSYGEFYVSSLGVQAIFRGQEISYITHVFESNASAMVAGREVWGTPKILADVTLEEHERTLVGRTVFEGVEVLVMTSTLGQPCEAEDGPSTPGVRLKIIPRADAPGPAIKQLVTFTPPDVVTHLLFKGTGTVQFGATALADFSALQPKEIVGAYYRVQSHTETYGQILFDYLAPEKESKPIDAGGKELGSYR